jgi:hypothetical protein
MCNSVYSWSSISSVIAQAVNRQSLVAEALVRSQAVSCWFFVDRLALGQTLLQVISLFYKVKQLNISVCHTYLGK